MRGALLLALALAVGAGGACKKKSAGAPGPAIGSAGGGQPNEVLPAGERTRGEEACAAYVKKLCDCSAQAPTDKALDDKCYMAKSMPQALTVSLDVANHPDTSPQTMTQLQREARKIVAQCIELTSKLPLEGCR